MNTSSRVIGLRYRSWKPTIPRFSSPKKPSRKTQTPPTPSKLASLRPHLRTDLPPKIKSKELKTRLSQALTSSEPFTADDFDILSNTIKEINKGTPLSDDETVDLFMVSADALLEQVNQPGNRIKMPKYLSQMISQLLTRQDLDTRVLTKLVLMGAAMTSLPVALSGLARTRDLPEDFLGQLISQLPQSLQTYEDIAGVFHDKLYSLNDDYYRQLMAHIESIYAEENPAVHEYLDLERSVDRIQLLMNSLVEHSDLSHLSTSTLLQLMKMIFELQSVSNWPTASANIKKLLTFLDNPAKYSEIRQVLFAQALEDEQLIETVLRLAHQDFPKLAKMLREFVSEHDVKFSPELQNQCQLYDIVHSSLSEDEKAKSMEEASTDIDQMMLALSTTNLNVRGHIYQVLTASVGSSAYSYKYLIDKAIADDDHVKAINLFDDSLERFTEWATMTDPSIVNTLNNLIEILCRHMDDAMAIFPIFTKIKQNMSTPQCSPEVIKAFAQRMLEQELVGDTIEMLKRELPKMSPDSPIKLPSDQPFGYKYNELFNVLHNFAITYTNESTHETNWVLYGELHKYFTVPNETYLPAMKFFCEHNRPNAALVILRQMNHLHGLHGDHQHLPPSKDVYKYLFEQFGDQLYEEGVIEVHESFKMDINIEQADLELQNTILNAYANLQDVARTRDLFLSLVPHGINSETATIMLKAYTYNDMSYVKEFFNNLSQFDLVADDKICQQYLIAHVYHGLVDEAIDFTQKMEDEYDVTVTSSTIIALHNYCIAQNDQKRIDEWAQQEFPQQWQAASTSGLLRSATDYIPDTNLLAEPVNS
ncbi:hypothetical protein DIURU_005476 [Diutina rugosa]|uniref:Mitochondrial group I intron splicing factor CCM1 n=1 Tax=Diutina rugosa TaxID=5481 RepID=A0A642UD56_DIURU|nr:uncharacterized protein DIURU_005476 [Diutina rugosa]KAA8896963.1 hypothetical protein DIURU_005476 [Diutina rugosa]